MSARSRESETGLRWYVVHATVKSNTGKLVTYEREILCMTHAEARVRASRGLEGMEVVSVRTQEKNGQSAPVVMPPDEPEKAAPITRIIEDRKERAVKAFVLVTMPKAAKAFDIKEIRK